ncbi:MAG: hypothetical protein HY562_00900 [Ignavibacteriales bacterium]|nr:hypothetical protein [Ignavibacteriales bacterium]
MSVCAWGCKDRITGELYSNRPPKTYIWVDTVASTLTSQVKLHWWGDDPDGFVVGYFVSIGGLQWTFTTRQDSTFTVQLGTVDTLLTTFRVAALDNSGNGVWDSNVQAGTISFGPEPYNDLDSNNNYSAGEPFVDLGAADPAPARLDLKIKNSPPTAQFANLTSIPSETLPVATFLIEGNDLDGKATIVNYFISLNEPDTSKPGWEKLPASASIVTIVGDSSQFQNSIISAEILFGTELLSLGQTISGLRLNSNNVVYLYCKDLSGASSPVVRMPDSTRTWYVRKPSTNRRLLLVNDYGPANPDPFAVYASALNAAGDGTGGTFGDYDLMHLINNPVPTPIHKPMLTATFRLYKYVFWFSKIANFNFAQNTLPEFMDAGGKVLISTGFQNFIDPQGLSIDFAPIDSLVTSYTDTAGNTRFGFIPRVYLNSIVLSSDTTRYPEMVFDRTAIFGSYAVAAAPGQEVIFRLDYPKNPPNTQETWVGQPSVGVRSSQGKMLFLTIPLHLMNSVDTFGSNRLVRFFEKVFRDDFGG